jgi:hypothetical protein
MDGIGGRDRSTIAVATSPGKYAERLVGPAQLRPIELEPGSQGEARVELALVTGDLNLNLLSSLTEGATTKGETYG